MEVMPSTEIRNNYAKVSQLAKSIDEPIILTKNGYADGIFMSMETFKLYQADTDLRKRIVESETQYKLDQKLSSHDEVFDMMEDIVRGYFDAQHTL